MSFLASPYAIEAARAAWDAWRMSRLTDVTSPRGDLALIETRWAAPGEGTYPVGELARLPQTVSVTPIQRTNLLSGDIERGVRLWDADAPAIRHFQTIDVFPFAPEWVIEAAFAPAPEARLMPFEHLHDNGGTRRHPVPGDITFALNGVPRSVTAFDDGGRLLLVFGDRTNGSSTYPTGRFLEVEPLPGGDRVMLDFNRAFVPPCGFSPHFNCPLPPAQNRFEMTIEAGEKRPLFLDGYQPR
ncbi:DUF1684 domain-containing protein [Microbispora sp. RL4-1S]|uniref:DUF1684 domain-containing protein n=1 Tax=Microbispora oryzae TaxID=2806554 RepID=A0A940WII9_9ACTN|nr:DUF1684 domain-containing protein [Microbispora oryzae]MBP2704597.1 DUF1684 domain-containing protein [Microbispora oryzae]